MAACAGAEHAAGELAVAAAKPFCETPEQALPPDAVAPLAPLTAAALAAPSSNGYVSSSALMRRLVAAKLLRSVTLTPATVGPNMPQLLTVSGC